MDSIIFDVDGTLWDSTDSVAASWNEAIRLNSSLELTLNREILSGLFGKTMTEIGDLLFASLPPHERLRLMELCFNAENRYLESHPGDVYPGVLKTIPELAKTYPLFIVSNCQCGYIEVMLRTTGLEPYIKDHLCFGETQVSKGQTIKMLIQKNHLKSPIYVGDTQGDADACKEADVPFLFAEYGFGHVTDDAKRIKTFSDLEKLLK